MSQSILNPDDIVSLKEISQITKMSPVTVRRFARAGRFGSPVFQAGPRSRRYRLGDALQAFSPSNQPKQTN
ncbi:MAG: hypothetical protein EBV06_11495 [Planctomycetia bacterium]|nr:hypothetical protein [Planctomycetia bacterium]